MFGELRICSWKAASLCMRAACGSSAASFTAEVVKLLALLSVCLAILENIVCVPLGIVKLSAGAPSDPALQGGSPPLACHRFWRVQFSSDLRLIKFQIPHFFLTFDF